ncbi:hypothetical protein [Mesorhizobium sp. M0847]|uniref:hypothetical protein n=1 Tax=unclassified Mesorhizobium TaxID=325217 RepID=UPI00333DAAB3
MRNFTLKLLYQYDAYFAGLAAAATGLSAYRLGAGYWLSGIAALAIFLFVAIAVDQYFLWSFDNCRDRQNSRTR